MKGQTPIIGYKGETSLGVPAGDDVVRSDSGLLLLGHLLLLFEFQSFLLRRIHLRLPLLQRISLGCGCGTAQADCDRRHKCFGPEYGTGFHDPPPIDELRVSSECFVLFLQAAGFGGSTPFDEFLLGGSVTRRPTRQSYAASRGSAISSSEAEHSDKRMSLVPSCPLGGRWRHSIGNNGDGSEV